MAYTLERFCADHRVILISGLPINETLDRIAEKLKVLLANPDFVAATFSDDTPIGRRTLHHDPHTDVYVLGPCLREGPEEGPPHSTVPPGRSTAPREPSPR